MTYLIIYVNPSQDDCQIGSLSAPMSSTQSNDPLKLTHLQTRIDAYKYSFLPRTTIQWNQLQIPVNNIDIDTFKNTFNVIYNCNH